MTTILIVDDCEETLESIAAMLEESKFQVVCTTDANRAVGICREINFDLVLCDLVMAAPSEQDCAALLGGIAALSQISSEFPKLPVVVMSGSLEEAPLRNLTQAGAWGTLTKPFSRERLLTEIAEHLPHHSAANEAA